jgi:hypothetical protein
VEEWWNIDKAVRVKQTSSGKWLVFFAAPAFDIDSWSGVPRKTQLEDHESTGFQRDLNKKRLKNLKDFYNDWTKVFWQYFRLNS